jgi:hypothetical protein
MKAQNVILLTYNVSGSSHRGLILCEGKRTDFVRLIWREKKEEEEEEEEIIIIINKL